MDCLSTGYGEEAMEGTDLGLEPSADSVPNSPCDLGPITSPPWSLGSSG